MPRGGCCGVWTARRTRTTRPRAGVIRRACCACQWHLYAWVRELPSLPWRAVLAWDTSAAFQPKHAGPGIFPYQTGPCCTMACRTGLIVRGRSLIMDDNVHRPPRAAWGKGRVPRPLQGQRGSCGRQPSLAPPTRRMWAGVGQVTSPATPAPTHDHEGANFMPLCRAVGKELCNFPDGTANCLISGVLRHTPCCAPQPYRMFQLLAGSQICQGIWTLRAGFAPRDDGHARPLSRKEWLMGSA